MHFVQTYKICFKKRESFGTWNVLLWDISYRDKRVGGWLCVSVSMRVCVCVCGHVCACFTFSMYACGLCVCHYVCAYMCLIHSHTLQFFHFLPRNGRTVPSFHKQNFRLFLARQHKGNKASVWSFWDIDIGRNCNQWALIWHKLQNCKTPKWSYTLVRW